MKKIIGSVAVLGAIWAGSTAYISSQTQGYIENQLEKTNQIYKHNGIKVSLASFKKGFLSSTATVQLNILEDAPLKEQLKKVLKLPFVTTYDIANGPIFFKNGFGFGTSKIENNMDFSKIFKQKVIQDFIGDNNLTFSYHTQIGFDNQAKYQGTLNALKFNLPTGEEMSISPLTIKGDMNIETLAGAAKLAIKHISIGADASMKDTIIDMDLKKIFDNGFYLADIGIHINKMNFDVKEVELKLKDASIDLDVTIDQNKDETIKMLLDLNVDISKSTLPTDIPALKRIALGYTVDGADFDGMMALQEFIQKMQEKQQLLIQELTTAKDMAAKMAVIPKLQAFQQSIMENFIVKGAGLLVNDKTTLSYYLKATDESGKESFIDSKLSYLGKGAIPATAKEIQEKFTKELLDILGFDATISLQESLIKSLPAKIAEDLSMKLNMASQQGMIKLENNAYIFNANYIPKKIMINDKDMTSMLLPFIQMGLGGL